MTSSLTSVFVCCGIFITSAANAQMPDPLSVEAEDFARIKYDQSSSLPDGVAFYQILVMLDQLSKTNEETSIAISIVQSGMRLDEKSATQFLSSLTEEFRVINSVIASSQYDEACLAGVPNTYGEGAYNKLERLDDIQDDVPGQSFLSFQAGLDDQTAQQLRRWVDSQKENITHIKFDHKKASTRADVVGDSTLAHVCTQLASQVGAEE